MKRINDQERKADIDAVGWIFMAFVVVITGLGAFLAYNGNQRLAANTPALQSSVTAISLR